VGLGSPRLASHRAQTYKVSPHPHGFVMSTVQGPSGCSTIIAGLIFVGFGAVALLHVIQTSNFSQFVFVPLTVIWVGGVPPAGVTELILIVMRPPGFFDDAITARPDRNESGFPRHAGGASLTH
jgi:hypothetical protein